MARWKYSAACLTSRLASAVSPAKDSTAGFSGSCFSSVASFSFARSGWPARKYVDASRRLGARALGCVLTDPF